MTTATASYERHKQRAAKRQADQSRVGRDIGDIPPVRNPARRAAAERSYLAFCNSYFPQRFTLPWSRDHLRLIERIETVVMQFAQLAVAMPRGSGKTSLCECAVLFAILTGRHNFIFLIGSSKDHADSMLQNLKSELEHNDLLLEDFPEVCYPIRCLEGEARRCAGQLHHGLATHIGWLADQIILPTIPGSRVSGAVVRVGGITGNLRGAVQVRSDGSSIRPSLAVVDDPQTDESARSPSQCASRIATIKGAIAGLAGPGKRTAIIVPCTVIQQDDLADQLLDRDKNPDFQGERCKLLYEFPTAAKLWEEYARRRSASLKAGGNGSEATEFYRQRRAEMDEGADPAWPERYDKATELSAIQHAMNLQLKDPAAFAAEYQNEPKLPDVMSGVMKIDQVLEKVVPPRRFILPQNTTHLTAAIDVSESLLWYVVTAWGEGFSGHVVDYGCWPEQPDGQHFTQTTARYTLSTAKPGAEVEAQIAHALESLTDQIVGMVWYREDGTELPISRCFIDAGYGNSTDVVRTVCRNSQHKSVLLPSFGRGITADRKAMSDYVRKAGERHGFNWYVTANKAGRHLIFDANAWKSFVQQRVIQPRGDRGSLTICEHTEITARIFAEHLTGEYPVRTAGQGRVVDVWKLRPGRDNHLFDCMVMAAVAASEQGIATIGHQTTASPRRRRRKIEAKF